MVLIQATDPTRSPLPVLCASDLSSRPESAAAGAHHRRGRPGRKQPVAQLGTTIDLDGHHLDGTGREVILVNDRFEIEETMPALAGGGDTSMQFSIPVARAADFPVGVYRVGARVQRPGETAPRETNRLAMTIAPKIDGLPMTVTRDAGGTASFTINFSPALRAGQTVRLVLGQQEFAPRTVHATGHRARLRHPQRAGGRSSDGHLARLRIDGIDSPIIDPAADTADVPRPADQDSMNAAPKVDWTEANQRYLAAEFARLKAQLSGRGRAGRERRRARSAGRAARARGHRSAGRRPSA